MIENTKPPLGLSREALLTKLRAITARQAPDSKPVCDEEVDHVEADLALLSYINDPEITEAYNAIGKWYA